jgi:hypothetical protein
MNLDKFPEAFERFEDRVDVDRFNSYMELTYAFRHWAGQKWIGTSRQWKAFNVEAERLGFSVPEFVRRELREAGASGSYVSEERRATTPNTRVQNTQFSRKYGSYSAWQKNTEGKTSYQKRVSNYMRKHPNASLAEARGHGK